MPGSDWKAYWPCGLLPAVMTAPEATRLAMEWYMRGTVAEAPERHKQSRIMGRLLQHSQYTSPGTTAAMWRLWGWVTKRKVLMPRAWFQSITAAGTGIAAVPQRCHWTYLYFSIAGSTCGIYLHALQEGLEEASTVVRSQIETRQALMQKWLSSTKDTPDLSVLFT